MSYLEEHDVIRMGREARARLLRDPELARRGRELAQGRGELARRGRELAQGGGELGRRGRELVERRGDIALRGRAARDWLTHDERGRVVGFVLLSVTMSIAMSLAATAIVGFAARRRASGSVAPADAATTAPGRVGEPLAAVAPVETPAGIPVMDVAPNPVPHEGRVPA